MDNTQNGKSEPTIRINRKPNRSTYMFVLQHLIKPLNTRVIEPKKAFPAGSNRLTPHKNASRECSITERKVEDIYIYDLTPKSGSPAKNSDKPETRKKRIYYFCGGSWQMPPSSQHWSMCAKMVTALPDTIVSVVSYPLAPESPAPIAFPQLMRMYRRMMKDSEEAGEKVVFGGDSSGGNIILCLVLAALAEDEHARCPKALMLISPSVDLRETNPRIKEVEKHDPILRLEFTLSNANKWRGEWAADDPRVTPTVADVSLLAKRGVEVHGVVGSYDILSADAILFREKCAKANVRGQWLEWEKQMHCFPLAWRYGLSESVEAADWIFDILRQI